MELQLHSTDGSNNWSYHANKVLRTDGQTERHIIQVPPFLRSELEAIIMEGP